MSWPYEIAERDHSIQDPTSPEKVRRVGEYLRLDASKLGPPPQPSRFVLAGCGQP
jgi:hypothetical protein